MTDLGDIIYRKSIKAYIIALWHDIDDYAKAYPERVTESSLL